MARAQHLWAEAQDFLRALVWPVGDSGPDNGGAAFRGTGDLDGLQAGTYDLPVRVEQLTGRGNLQVTQVIPDTLQVELKSLFSKSVSVSVSLEGTPPPGYEASVPEVEADTILVTGAQDRVTLVSQAVAKLDLTGHTEDLTQAVRLEARGSRGVLVGGGSAGPRGVNASR